MKFERHYLFSAGLCNIHVVCFLGRVGYSIDYPAKAWDSWARNDGSVA